MAELTLLELLTVVLVSFAFGYLIGMPNMEDRDDD